MKILNNYDELILCIDSKDTKRFENLLAYSDCRNDLIKKYIQNFGIENITKLMQNVEAKALKLSLEKICSDCQNSGCEFYIQNSKPFTKKLYVHQANVDSNIYSHNYNQFS